jgi:hypothetical protein
MSGKFLAGEIDPQSLRQFEMARILAQKKIPVIVSVWDPPEWARDTGPRPPSPFPQPQRGHRLDATKMQQIADSIANFLLFLKRQYGVEPFLFSFNEPDYGVQVKQTPEDHALANKVIGRTFADRGLKTKMLAGDTGAGTATANLMVLPTQNDPGIHPYVGAVSFHTWHGVMEPDLSAWAESARSMNIPLIVAEAGNDSAAHAYPLVFQEPWFALREIQMFVRIAQLAQPLAIMPWQYTADYSLLAGGGIYGDQGPLRPTQRFWNVKQLGSTPQGAFWIPISADRPNITAAAAGDIANGKYAIHIVNAGAARDAVISGVPSSVKQLRLYVTDAQRGMAVGALLPVKNGRVQFKIDAACFVSLFSE